MTRTQSTVAVTSVLLILGAVSAIGQVWDREGTNIVLVAKKGGDFRSIQAALDSITDAREGNPYLVYVAPGVYEEQIVMKPFIDVEGAGEGLTRISSAGRVTIEAAGEAELRSLTVECSGPVFAECSAIAGHSIQGRLTIHQVTLRSSGRQAYGVHWPTHGGLSLRSVTMVILPNPEPGRCQGFGLAPLVGTSARADRLSIVISGESCESTGIMVLARGSIEITDSEILVEGSSYSSGIAAGGPEAVADLRNVRVLGASVALKTFNPGSRITVRQSAVHGDIRLYAGELGICHSEFTGQVQHWFPGTVTCFSTFGEGMVPLDDECQPLSLAVLPTQGQR